MIDVDIVGQLIPNPITMLVQLCSTLVLFLVAKKFLWNSVKGFLDARSDKMQADLSESEEAKQKALQDRQTALSELNEASDKAEEIVSTAIKQAKDEKNSILERASKEAEMARKKAQEQIEADRSAMVKDMQREIVEVAMSAATKLVQSKDPEEFDREAINAFVKEASGDYE